uniref:Uncharacterized protein n=1 Tax=Vespula pensylvanica TaxID=30213 RepID=A0A834P4W9_VESPE|nr:hypothetical protein H0235_005571 [Vespula pensylvanica]
MPRFFTTKTSEDGRSLERDIKGIGRKPEDATRKWCDVKILNGDGGPSCKRGKAVTELVGIAVLLGNYTKLHFTVGSLKAKARFEEEEGEEEEEEEEREEEEVSSSMKVLRRKTKELRSGRLLWLLQSWYVLEPS